MEKGPTPGMGPAEAVEHVQAEYHKDPVLSSKSSEAIDSTNYEEKASKKVNFNDYLVGRILFTIIPGINKKIRECSPTPLAMTNSF